MLILLLLVGAGGLGWHALMRHRLQQGVGELGDALTRRDLARAAFLLRSLESRHPGHPDLLPPKARFLNLIGSRQAAPAWVESIRLHPQNPEYRVAAVLAHLQDNDIAAAQLQIDRWPEPQKHPGAYARACLALAFAREDWSAAEKHALFLAQADPSSLTAQLNLAKIRLHGPQASIARSDLLRLAGQPQLREEAMRALFQDALSQNNPDEVRRLVDHLHGLQPVQPGPLILALESLQRTPTPPTDAEVHQAWDACRAHPADLARLTGWMTATKRASLTWRYLKETPPANSWSFPQGFAFVETAIAVGQEKEAWPQLTRVEWPGLEDLRHLCLARLSWGSTAAVAQLERSLTLAARRPGGLIHLLHVVEQWRWEPGLVAVLQARIQSPDPTPREFAALFAFYEKRRDTGGMLSTCLRHLQFHPDHPIALNNAAYFSALRLSDLDRAAVWARRAHELRPSSPELAATLALVMTLQGQLDPARSILDRFPPSPETILAHLAWFHASKLPVPHELNILKSRTSVVYPEEESILNSPSTITKP
jgi:hypothetical protein